MKTNFVIFVLLVGLAISRCKEIKYKDCGSAAVMLSVEVEPCDFEPCVFKRGNTTAVRFTLISDQDSDTATLDAMIEVLGIMVPIPGVEKDLCKAVIQCPVVKGNVYNATMYAHVSSWSPSIETTVQIKITGDEGLSVCIRSKIVIA